MPLPGYTIDDSYRSEEVDLQPGGSTITVTAPSDNPFELAGDDIEIVTQASGGMAGADPRQRSKRTIYQGKRNHATKPMAVHMNAGFMPGMGDGDEIELGAMGPVRRAPGTPRMAKSPRHLTAVHAGFMPGMGDDDQMDGMGAIDPKDPNLIELDRMIGQTNAEKAQAAALEQKRLDVIGQAATAGLTALSKQMDARAADANAKAVAARASGDKATAAAATQQAQLAAQQADAARRNAGLSTGAKVGIGFGALVAVGLVVFLILRKKGQPS